MSRVRCTRSSSGSSCTVASASALLPAPERDWMTTASGSSSLREVGAEVDHQLRRLLAEEAELLVVGDDAVEEMRVAQKAQAQLALLGRRASASRGLGLLGQPARHLLLDGLDQLQQLLAHDLRRAGEDLGERAGERLPGPGRVQVHDVDVEALGPLGAHVHAQPVVARRPRSSGRRR